MSEPEYDPYAPPGVRVGESADSRPPTEPVTGNPWLTVWVRPRGTIRRIVDADPNHGVIALGALGGFTGILVQAYNWNYGDKYEPGVILALASVIGTTAGVIQLYLVGALVRWTGSWFGGAATSREVRAALAWGSVPNAVTLALLALMIVVAGPGFFQKDGLARLGPQVERVIADLFSVMGVLAVWSVVITIRAVGEVHRFSSWISLAAWILANLLVIGFILIVAAAMLATGLLQLGGG